MSNSDAALSDSRNHTTLNDVLPPTSSNTQSGNDENAWAAAVPAGGIGSLLGSRAPRPPLTNGPHRYSTHRLSRIIEECQEQIQRGSPVDIGTFGAVFDALKNKNTIGLDDRKFLLEKILVFLARLPEHSTIGTQVEHFLINLLYKDLPHPPSTYLGPIPASTTSSGANVLGLTGFSYREPDGSNNNPLLPHLGAAHTPYARSVASSLVAPVATLPDPGLVFDTLMKRDKHVDHPTGLSSLFFAFANVIIHSLFRTKHGEWSINETSSYLDLSPLYGVDGTEQDGVRRKDGTGRLWDDVIADVRLLAMPPASCALLVVFNRNHNYIATRIREINERGTFSSNPFPTDEKKLKAQDDEIFNRAKLVNCGTFMQVIMRDYVGGILRMIPDLTSWHLRPLDAIRDSNHEFTPRGEGNVCSVEFNLLYRWHATTSVKDEKWLDAMWKNMFADKAYDEVTPREFGTAVLSMLPKEGPREWTFGGLQRDKHTGRFDDAALAEVLQSATADSAGAFRARGIPAMFRVIEILGMEQARKWGVCSLNEFRTFLGLKAYKSFEEWNPDPEIASIAERLYHHIDNLELHVGMQAEETRPSIPGSGLCSGYTMSRAILADAVALIRGDRFLTIEYTPFNLTSWGFRDAETDDNNGSFGGMLPKLLFRALPQHYSAGNVYAHFPFMIPSRMEENMRKKEPAMVKEYDWRRPHAAPVIKPVDSFDAVKEVVKEGAKLSTPYEARAAKLTDGYGFYLVGDKRTQYMQDRDMIERALFTPVAISQHAQFYYEKTRELIAIKGFTANVKTKIVDIVHDVLNYVPVHWVATRVAGLSLQTPENPDGKYSENQLHGYLAVLFTYIYLNSEPVNAWFLEQHSIGAARLLLNDIKENLEDSSSHFSRFKDSLSSLVTGGGEADASEVFLRHLREANSARDIDELVYTIFGVIINSVANWAHAMTHVVNFYLDDAQKRDKDAIVAIAGRQVTEESERLLIGYVKEALRLDPPVAGVMREVRANIQVSGTQVNAGEMVFANLASAIVDADRSGPNVVTPGRQHPEPGLSFIIGAHTSPDEKFSDKTMAHVLRAIFGLKNLRRAPESSGQLARFTQDIYGTPQKLYIDHRGQVTRWPQSLLVQFDV